MEEENFLLVAITSDAPKVGVTASKLVHRKEKMGYQGFQNYFKSTEYCSKHVRVKALLPLSGVTGV